MAAGDFSKDVTSAGWFGSDQRATGWFDRRMVIAATAAASSILALFCGYVEAAPAPDVEDSYVQQVIEDAAATEPGVPSYYPVDLEPEEEATPDWIGLLFEDAPAAAPSDIAPLTAAYFDAAPDEALDGFVPSWTEDAPAQPDFIVQITTDLEPDAPIEVYGLALFLLDPPAAAPDLTQIPDPVITDPEESAELEDAVLVLLYEDDAQPFTIDFPDEDYDEITPDSVVASLYEDSDLTFVPGWQDDFLADYEAEAQAQAEWELLALVFDPYAQIEAQGPVWPNPSDVTAGVVYGPTGTEYTGTKIGGSGSGYIRRR